MGGLSLTCDFCQSSSVPNIPGPHYSHVLRAPVVSLDSNSYTHQWFFCLLLALKQSEDYSSSCRMCLALEPFSMHTLKKGTPLNLRKSALTDARLGSLLIRFPQPLWDMLSSCPYGPIYGFLWLAVEMHLLSRNRYRPLWIFFPDVCRVCKSTPFMQACRNLLQI